MKFPNIHHIYIVHCPCLTDRYAYLKKVMEKYFPHDYYTFKVNTHKDTLTDEIINKYYTLDENVRNTELRVIGEEKNLTQKINKGNISCGINHLLIWEEVSNSKHDRVLILEDDILFLEDTLSYMIEIMAEINDEHDIVSLEDGAGLTVESMQIEEDLEKTIYKIESGRMRCTGAYSISKNACTKLVELNKQRKFSLEIDMQLWFYGALKLIGIYWSSPTAFTQGSQKGVFKSEIQEKQNHFLQNIKLDNKKCICIGLTYLQTAIALIKNHSCSCLFFNINSTLESEKYSIKIIKEDITKENVCEIIKSNYFDGSIEVLCFGINDSDILKRMIVDSIIVNPKIIMCCPKNESFLRERYDLVDKNTGVFIRKDQVS